ncbi:MAG: SPOR domain-containing protein, partial [Gemmatimonadota bacterium]
VRPTSLAFRIQDFDTRAAALSRRDQLAAQGVPTYVVEVPYTVGPPHYRIYAGAYEYRSEAQVMAQLLQSAGIDAPLVPRTGRPVA